MLLLDTDYIAYKAAQACEEGIDFGDDVIVSQSNFSQVLRIFERELQKIQTDMMDNNIVLYFSSSENFRKKSIQITRVTVTGVSLWVISAW